MTTERDAITGRLVATDVVRRFWAQVEKQASCWVWCGGLTRGGYGRIWGHGRQYRAHRLSWIIHYGVIPEDLWVLHKCDNPLCVNPEHLWLGDHDDNMRDKYIKGRNCYGDENGSRTHLATRPRGERHSAAKLSNEEARMVFDAYHRGTETQKQLAVVHGISQQSISQIVRAEGRFTFLAGEIS